MAVKSPLFSIVIPTRNRAKFLRYALQSALNQQVDDLEIIVSDNSSSDDTPKVVSSFGDPRIRFFRTPRPLSMPDSWEFALSKAEGHWITFLTDKSVFNPRFLQILRSGMKQESQVFAWSWSSYCYDTDQGGTEPNQLLIYPFSGKTTSLPASRQLGRLFETDWFDRTHLYLVNACYDRRVVEAVKAKCGRFMIPPIADAAAAVAVLSVIDQYRYIDLPLTVLGVSREGTTASFETRNDTFWKFVEQFPANELFGHVPLRIYTASNFYSESLLRARELIRDSGPDLNWNWRRYFLMCYNDLFSLEQRGIDVADEKRQFFDVLGRQPVGVQVLVRVHKFAKVVRRAARLGVNRVGVLGHAERVLRGGSQHRKVRGDDVGFHDILGAASYLDRLLRESIPGQT